MRIDGTPNNDILPGTPDADQIFGYAGNDQISGLAGDDYIDGGSGDDTMDGGQDNDVFVVDSIGDAVFEAAGGGDDRVIALASYTLPAGAYVETLTTGNANATAPLTLRGNDFAQSIYGNQGANLLSGRGGNDYLVGLGGNDILIGGAGNDIMDGGDGNDQYQVDSTSDRVIEHAGGGDDLITTTVSFQLEAGIAVETLAAAEGTAAIALTGNELAQSLYGNDGNNALSGGGGTDYLVGEKGDDTYYVTDGRELISELDFGGFDTVYAVVDYTLGAGAQVEVLSAFPQTGTSAINLKGNQFSNHVIGNDGANTLSGGAGMDALSGRGGADVFLFDQLGESNADRILDFIGGSDRIGLDHAVFTGLQPGPLGASEFRLGTYAQDADDHIIYDQASGNLWFDADGNGPAAMQNFAVVMGGIPLSASDFLVL